MNIRTSKEVEVPKFQSIPIFHLFEFEGGSDTIVALKKVRFGNGGLQVAPGWKITKKNWIVDGINITNHLNVGSLLTVEVKTDGLHVISGFPDLRKSNQQSPLPSNSGPKNYTLTSETHEKEEVTLTLNKN